MTRVVKLVLAKLASVLLFIVALWTFGICLHTKSQHLLQLAVAIAAFGAGGAGAALWNYKPKAPDASPKE